MNIRVIDDFLPDPRYFRALALSSTFATHTVAGQDFHGIAGEEPDHVAVDALEALFPTSKPMLSFFRKSPAGQVEPNDIHSDAGMGHWTGILYLNPNPPVSDGTAFWRHIATCREVGYAEWREDGHDRSKWAEVCMVPARFNRLLLFQADLFHSRSMIENYGEGDEARLIQVIFGKGVIPWQ